MFDASAEVELHVGDEVLVDSLNGQRGKIESIRVISDAQVVQKFNGCPSGVVLTIQSSDAVINVRGADVTLPHVVA
ncbi:MAG: hypothetical protein P9L94_02535 [Candidatus Hinthialibacter antarcticus]|nr:hypothetical protein [Candidatus Hinthialibacter antarcticus]